jgi:hypothetical protein
LNNALANVMNFGLPKDRDDRAKMFLGDDFYGQCAATIYCGTPDEGKTGDMVYIPKNIGLSAWRWV